VHIKPLKHSCAFEVTTLWRYTNLFIIIIVIIKELPKPASAQARMHTQMADGQTTQNIMLSALSIGWTKA